MIIPYLLDIIHHFLISLPYIFICLAIVVVIFLIIEFASGATIYQITCRHKWTYTDRVERYQKGAREVVEVPIREWVCSKCSRKVKRVKT